MGFPPNCFKLSRWEASYYLGPHQIIHYSNTGCERFKKKEVSCLHQVHNGGGIYQTPLLYYEERVAHLLPRTPCTQKKTGGIIKLAKRGNRGHTAVSLLLGQHLTTEGGALYSPRGEGGAH